MSTAHTKTSDLLAGQRQLAVNQLAAGVAHEFNNVLQIVSGYVTFARDNLPAGSPARDDLDHALCATARAAQLSSRLLQFARAEDGECQVADANDAVEALQLLLQPIIGEDIRIEVSCQAGLPEAAAGDASLRQALLNLGVNARDAMPSGGTLRVTTELVKLDGNEPLVIGRVEAGDFVCLSVEDTGDGMTDLVRERVFEAFFTTKASGTGTGLGLAMVAEFIEQIGGGMQVVSELGDGTRFDLYLPVAEKESSDASLARVIDSLSKDAERFEGAV